MRPSVVLLAHLEAEVVQSWKQYALFSSRIVMHRYPDGHGLEDVQTRPAGLGGGAFLHRPDWHVNPEPQGAHCEFNVQLEGQVGAFLHCAA